MSDFRFEFDYSIKSNTYQAASMAVLYPLAVRIQNANKEDLNESLDKLLQMWRARTALLFNLNYSRFQNDKRKLANVRNCWPLFSKTKLIGQGVKVPRCCDYENICPWCYARRLVRIYESLEENINNCGIIFGFHKKVKASYLECDESAINNQREFFKTTIKQYRNISLGGHWLLTIEPEEDNQWLFHYRAILLIKHDKEISKYPDDYEYRELKLPVTKKEVKSLFASILRYPVNLITGNPQQTVNILNTKSKIRLSESFGCFRNSKKKEA